MVSLPRVITVDPSGDAARYVRAAVQLAERPIIQIDVPSGEEALAELNRGGCHMLVSSLRLDNGTNGVELAQHARQVDPQTAVVLIDAGDELDSQDESALHKARIAVFQRPFDAQQFVRVVVAGIDGRDVFTAYAPLTVSANGGSPDHGAIPPLDLKAAGQMIDTLLTDIGALAIVLASRGGELLLERGAVGYMDRDQLAAVLAPMVNTVIDMRQVVGGQQIASLQFYDGETYDVFVLSVGLHHFMCLIFDGQIGSRQFGAVNRFGRRTAEDLIQLLGASAFNLHRPTPSENGNRRHMVKAAEPAPQEEPIEPLVERAEVWGEPVAPPEPEPVRLEPIANFDPTIFDKTSIDAGLADELFDPDRLAEIANETRRERGPLSYDEARELGIIP